MGYRVIVSHAGYGCDTGCCGHVVEVEKDGEQIRREFDFSHPYSYPLKEEDAIAYAKDLVRRELGEKHVADLDWANCDIQDH